MVKNEPTDYTRLTILCIALLLRSKSFTSETDTFVSLPTGHGEFPIYEHTIIRTPGSESVS